MYQKSYKSPIGTLYIVEENEKIILSMLKELSQKGKCVIVVSHSLEAKKYADKIYKLNNGNLIGD